jgi:metallo-beta-lactamase class B
MLCALLAGASSATLAAGLVADPPKSCGNCDKWNKPVEPFRVYGNTWYVGVEGLSSVLITSDEGHILIDGALTQSAPLIAANIEKLGFKLSDVKLIATSHAHYDHVGGIAALARASGARVVASTRTAQALRAGGPPQDDPQIAYGVDEHAFPAVANVEDVADGATVKVGALAITAHYTPGHTPGAVAWTWRSCAGSDCKNIVYADSINPVAHDSYRFGGADGKSGVVASFRAGIAAFAALPCDVLLSAHPSASDMDKKVAARAQGVTPDPFVDAQSCKHYAKVYSDKLDERLAKERAPARP